MNCSSNNNDFLIYDIQKGWKPNIHFDGLIPLIFKNNLATEIFKNLNTKLKDYNLIYKCIIPDNNYEFHLQNLKNNSNYNINGSSFLYYSNEILRNALFKIKNNFYGNSQLVLSKVIFNSNFESGNLNFVWKNKDNNDNNYFLFLKIDSNTKGHTQWFYFNIESKVNTNININIVNMSKKKSVYNKKGKPFVLIVDKNNKIIKNWTMLDDSYNVSYKENKDIENKLPFHDLTDKDFSTLKFTININKNYKYYLCYTIPYTFSKLNEFIFNINNNFLKKKFFCKNKSGINIPYLKITDYNCNKIIIKNRPIVYIFGRIHPSETAGSFVCEGIIKKLLDNSKEMSILRKIIIFKIIPMINVDGVILGNFRTSLFGDDLNRQFKNTNKNLHYIISKIKKKIKIDLLKGKKILAAYDLHGHSNRENVFIYGANYKMKKNKYPRGKIYAYLMSKKNNIFKYPYCIWSLAKWKISTLRGFLLKNLKTKLVFTVESSVSHYIIKDKFFPFKDKDYIDIGKDFMITLHDFIKLSVSNEDYIVNNFFINKEIELENKKIIIKDIFGISDKITINLTTIKKEIKKLDNDIILQKIKNNEQDYIEGGSDSEDSFDDYNNKQRKNLLEYFKKYQDKYSKMDLTKIIKNSSKTINLKNSSSIKNSLKQKLSLYNKKFYKINRNNNSIKVYKKKDDSLPKFKNKSRIFIKKNIKENFQSTQKISKMKNNMSYKILNMKIFNFSNWNNHSTYNKFSIKNFKNV